MKIGILGIGHIGKTLAQRLSSAGHDVKVAHSRGPETIPVDVLSTGARAVSAEDAVVDVDTVVLSLPMRALEDIASLISTIPANTVVIDTSVYYPYAGKIEALEAGEIQALWVEKTLGRTVVKAWNTIAADVLAAEGKPANVPDRIALPVSGNHDKKIGMALVEDTGFDAVDAGDLTESWRLEPGSPAHCTDLTRNELITALASADRTRLTKRRDLLTSVFMERFADGNGGEIPPGYFTRLSRAIYL